MWEAQLPKIEIPLFLEERKGKILGAIVGMKGLRTNKYNRRQIDIGLRKRLVHDE